MTDRGEPAIVGEIFALFDRAGADAYHGEAVTQREHALQTALGARRAGAPDALVAAALLHDVGHLLHALGEDAAARGIDARHEEVGADRLAPHFPPEVVEPVRLHVAAKRWLCAAEPAYAAGLSPASVRSLELQGGPMGPEEAARFLDGPYGRDAVLLRRCDEAGKVAGLETPPLAAYRDLLARLAAG
jgi:phosphonate degradation associated HDIG domain protein